MTTTFHDGPDDLSTEQESVEEWNQGIVETPRFKEKLPSIFEPLAASLTERSVNAAKKSKSSRGNKRGRGRRVGSWRWFAWSTAMAVVMALLATIFLHSWIEERAMAQADERIAEMERESRQRIEKHRDDIATYVREHSTMLTRSADTFDEILRVGNMEVAALFLYHISQEIRTEKRLEDLLVEYELAVDKLSKVNHTLTDVDLSEYFDTETDETSAEDDNDEG